MLPKSGEPVTGYRKGPIEFSDTKTPEEQGYSVYLGSGRVETGSQGRGRISIVSIGSIHHNEYELQKKILNNSARISLATEVCYCSDYKKKYISPGNS